MPQTADDLASRITRLRSSQSLAGALGRSNKVDKLDKRLERLTGKFTKKGGDLAALEPGTDFSEGDFDISEASSLRRPVTSSRKKRSGQRADLFRNQLQELKQERRVEEAEQRFDEEIDPLFTDTRERLERMLAADTITAEEVSRARTEITEQNRSAAASRLRRVSSVLGVQGIGPDSPAGQALIARDVRESDKLLMDALRNLGFEVDSLNEAGERADIELTSRTLASQIAARDAATRGDKDRLLSIQSELSSILTALNERRSLEALQKELLSDQLDGAKDSALISAGADVLGSVGSALIGGGG